MSRDPVLTFTPAGIYCPAGDFYIDPWRRVDRALITHGHSDHARWGMGHYLATHEALPVIRHEPVRCHHFITESTFGLPVFRWEPQSVIAAQINDWWRTCAAQGKTAVLGAYSLGKAQRLMSMLDPSIGPVLCHAAIESTNAVMRAQGIRLPDTVLAHKDITAKTHPAAMVIAPPSALGSTWTKRFGLQETGFASGWMAMRGVRRRRAGDRGFVISDHADWAGLLSAIKNTSAENIYVTHGYTDTFTRYLNDSDWTAQVVPTQFEGENLDSAGSEGE